MTVAEIVGALGLLFTALGAVVSYIAARAGAGAAIKVHLDYLRRDVDDARRSCRAAHWRLDEIAAPPSPGIHQQ